MKFIRKLQKCIQKTEREARQSNRVPQARYNLRARHAMRFFFSIFQTKSYTKNKIFFATLFRLANDHNQSFVQNAYKNFDFSQQKKILQNIQRKSNMNEIACKNFRHSWHRKLCIKKSAKIHKCDFYWKISPYFFQNFPMISLV